VNVVSPFTAANGAVEAIASRRGAGRATAGACWRGISQQRAVVWPCLALLLALAGCQSNGAPGGGGASPPTPASPASYPDLASVPPRPQLGYTIEQRKEVADALIADRANARHRQAELAYATGRSATPPPPRPTPQPTEEAPAAAAAPPPAGDAEIARAYVDANLNAASDEGKLRQFMRRLDRKIPDPYGPRSVTELVGLAPRQPEEATAAPEGEEGAGFGGFLGGLLGVEPTGGDTPSGAASR
jgi:hypothetical protein